MVILVLEANCISNLNPNHSYLTTDNPRTSVRESLQLHFKHMMLLWCSVVTISARPCVGYWMFFGVTRSVVTN